MKTIWLIDDDQCLTNRLVQAAKAWGWQLQEFGAEDTAGLPESDPDLVLLDYGLSKSEKKADNFRKAWLAILHTRGLLVRTCVVTYFPAAAKTWAEQQGVHQVLLKPLDLEIVERILTGASTAQQNIEMVAVSSDHSCALQSPQSAPNFPFADWFDAVDTPISILDGQANLIVQNKSAKKQPIFVSDQLGAPGRSDHIVQLLGALLNQLSSGVTLENKMQQAQKWDWNEYENKWEEWRLHRLMQGDSQNGRRDEYWLSRTLHTEITPMNESLLADKLELDEYLEALAPLLFDQWGVTRLRLYAVAPRVGARQNDEIEGWRMLPLAQVGDGFKENAAAWFFHEYDFEMASHSDEMEQFKEGTLLLRNISHDKNIQLSPIEWGDAKTRIKMMIGSEVLKYHKKLPKFLGQLSFDRRTDHHKTRKSGVVYGPLADRDVTAMTSFFKRVHADLAKRMLHRRDVRMMHWQKSISKVLTEGMGSGPATTTIAGQPYDVAKILICQAFDELMKSWNVLQAAPWESGESERSVGPEASSKDLRNRLDNELLELYVAEGLSDQMLRCEIGAHQPVFALRSHRRDTWHSRWPFSEAWAGKPYEVYVIQDFKAARAKNPRDPIPELLSAYRTRGVSEELLVAAQAQYAEVGSWVGMKIPRESGKHWLLIAMARGKNVWTKSRVDWLRALGKRLATVLRWWNAETEREWFRHALAHELRKPMQNLEGNIVNWLELEQAKPRPKSKAMRVVKQTDVENLLALVKLHGHMIEDIQEITGLRFGNVNPILNDACDFEAIKNNAGWLFGYHKNEIEVICEESSYFDLKLLVPEKALTHIVINLLLNAIKFNFPSLGKKVKIELNIVIDGKRYLVVSVANALIKPIPEEQYKEILLPYVKLRPEISGSTEGMGAGLAVVDALCRKHEIKLSIENKKAEEFLGYWQIFKINIPIQEE